MRLFIIAALALSATAVRIASAQIPRDPLATGTNPPGAGAVSARELPTPYVTRQSDLEIPFSVRAVPGRDSQPTAVRIFISWDQGKSWHFYEERRVEDGRFRFRPRQDGEYWFVTQTIDSTGRPDAGPDAAGAQPRLPQLRLVIDTQRPQLLVQAQADASGSVQLAWSAADSSLVPASFKVEYQDAATGAPWEAVEARWNANASATTQLSGQTSFRPVASSPAINLRAEVADAAGNVAYFSQRLSLAPKKTASGLAYMPAPDPSATPWPIQGSPHASREGIVSRSETTTMDEQLASPNLVNNPFVGRGHLASMSAQSRPVADPLPLPALPREVKGASDDSRPPVSNSGSATTDPLNDSRNPALPQAGSEVLPLPRGRDAMGASPPTALPPAATTIPHSPILSGPGAGPASEVMPAPQPSGPVETPSGERPRLTNSRRFSLAYDVQSVGPEGLAAVELWATTDGGQTWAKWGADPDKASPFDVEVNHEAVYGFRIVIVGKNGLATSTPQAGDAADIWVAIDLKGPEARLTGASYGQGDAAGKLDIRWQAADENLGDRPITLAISDRADGPFKVIAAGLPNTGQYFWEFDPRSPRQIYLRLEVRDEAGNTAIDQLTEPVKVEGLEPRGRIRSFNPGPPNSGSAPRVWLLR